MRRRFSRGFRRGAKRRPTQWVAGEGYASGVVQLVTGPTQSSFLMLAANAGAGAAVNYNPPEIERFTLERIRGQVLITVDSVPNSGAVFACSIGIIKLPSTSAASIIPDDIPSPSSRAEAGRDWLWLHHWALNADTPIGVNGEVQTLATMPGLVDVDIKSKRVFREQDALILTCTTSTTNTNGGSGAELHVDFFLRSLISRVA